MDLTAMIDIVLLLIIFFVLGTEFAPLLRTPLDLPRERGSVTTSSQSLAVLLIDITKDGTYRYAGEDASLARVLQLINTEIKRAKLGGRSGDKSRLPDVLVRADRSCPARHLNALAIALASAGVRDWKLATSEVQGSSGVSSRTAGGER
jgi:biopolymer transport protein ExbD